LSTKKQPGSREAERAQAADPPNLLRVMPAEGEMQNSTATNRSLPIRNLGRAFARSLPVLDSNWRREVHRRASGALRKAWRISACAADIPAVGFAYRRAMTLALFGADAEPS